MSTPKLNYTAILGKTFYISHVFWNTVLCKPLYT